MGLTAKKRVGRPSKMSEEEILRIVKEHEEISQLDLQKITGLRQNSLSLQIKRMKTSGMIATRKIRRGRINISMISATTLEDHLPHFGNQETS